MLDKEVIRPGVSPYSARVVPVEKKDGSIRFCIDYRRLNADTISDAFPLPRMTNQTVQWRALQIKNKKVAGSGMTQIFIV